MVKRPDWSRDETILALDLYFHQWPIHSEDDERITALSAFLRSLNPLVAASDPVFRNPAGVYRKLTNLLSLDPKRSAVGSPHASETDRAVFRDFVERLDALTAAAETIRSRSTARSFAGQPTNERKIWITGMWGFDPSIWGFLGFSTPAIREDFLTDYQENDLVLVVGQNVAMAQQADVGRLLGFLKLRKERIRDFDRMPNDEYDLKVQQFGKERWSYALPATAAWRIGSPVMVRHLLPHTYSGRNPQLIGSRYRLVDDAETGRLNDLRLVASRVYGQHDWNDGLETETSTGSLKILVSRGPKPHFGNQVVAYTESSAWIYIFRLEGISANNFETPDNRPLSGRKVFKIGWCVDPRKRLKTLNSALPDGLRLRWKPYDKRLCSSRDEAHAFEQEIFDFVESSKISGGGEFVVADFTELAQIQHRWFSTQAGRL